ncbi:DUF4347 domain-containing protein, partial [Pantanalinema sp. GBBB05]|uniref:DUF4347 domain-containing protein n=1 Tax=Pantanalinema sp. GBBB05 TaxID=2604139 RepID=UPI001E0548BF|nr:DUF4347 domain-containing protein [Pantanalinema sp. GBBB05]
MDLLSSSAPDNQALSTTIAASPTPYPTSDALRLTPLRPASSLVFIDSAVADGQFLATNVTAGSEVHFLDPTQDAIAQITNTLLGREGIASIHIVSHGEAGGLDFGSGQLNLSDLPEFTSQIQSWKTALTDDGDILLYGCDVAKGELGQAFVQILSQLTGADVAASNDLTGSEALDGNWNLEFNTGKIESSEAFQFQSKFAYNHTLATFTVTNTSDSGAGSLRQAILDANASTGADTITFAGPTFTDGTPDVIRLASELFVNDDLIIQGTGINNLTISGDANNSGSNDAGDVRVFFVNTGTVILQNLSIANGRAQGGDGGAGVGGGGGGAGLGGGLLINDANVTLQNVAFSNNQAIGGAGASGSSSISFSGGGGGGIGGAGGSATGYDFNGYGGVGGNGGNFGGVGGAGRRGVDRGEEPVE